MSLVSVTGVTSDGSVSADSEDNKQLNSSYVKHTDRLPSVDQGCRNERGDDMSQTSRLARQVTLDEAWSSSAHSEICCLIYATQNGWKLPILFEEMGVPYDWALVDFEKSEQRSERFLSINPNARIPAR